MSVPEVRGATGQVSRRRQPDDARPMAEGASSQQQSTLSEFVSQIRDPAGGARRGLARDQRGHRDVLLLLAEPRGAQRRAAREGAGCIGGDRAVCQGNREPGWLGGWLSASRQRDRSASL